MPNKANFDSACNLYIEFLEKYSIPHNYNGRKFSHSVPSSFIYSCIKENSIWLLNLIVGVAGYSIYFDSESDSSRVITRAMLEASGVKDPCLQLKSTLEPWTGLLSSGKSPYSPVDKMVTGVGIAHFNRGGLAPFYKASPIQVVLPRVKKGTSEIVRDESGEFLTDSYIITYLGTPVYGWGMDYGSSRLPLSCVSSAPDSLSYYTESDSRVSIKGDLKDKTLKLIGPSYGSDYKTTKYMTKEEADKFVLWCSYHLNHSRDRLYPALLWMSKYWAPFLSWHNGTQENSIETVMMASSVYNSGGLRKQDLQGQTLESIVEKYLSLSESQSDREHKQRRVLNTQRAIALLEFIKRV